MNDIETFSQQTPQQEHPEYGREGSKTSDDVFGFLDRTGFINLRKSDEEFNDWLQGISYQDYKDYLTRLNGIIREVPIEARSTDGEYVEISSKNTGIGFIPPPAEEKNKLMETGFEAIKKVSDANDRALLAYYLIQAIHPYLDGNGRTGRLVYEAMSDNGKSITTNRLSELLDHHVGDDDIAGEGRKIFAEKIMSPDNASILINREVVKSVFGDDFLKKYGVIFYNDAVEGRVVPQDINLPPKDKLLVEKILSEWLPKNFPFRAMTVLKFLQLEQKVGDYKIEFDRLIDDQDALPEDIGKSIFCIDGEKFEKDLKPEDIDKLIEINKEIKTIYIKEMIDIFVNPANHKIASKDGTETVQIKDIFHLG